MTPVLDHPEVRESLMPIPVEFYHELGRLGMIGEDVELLEGFLIRKMSKPPLHETIVRRFAKVLMDCLPAGFFLVKESPLTLECSEPEPDLAVIAGDPEEFVSSHPSTAVIIVEVAVSTVQKDRSKAAIYAAAGVGEYWLIEPERKCLTVYRLPGIKGYGEAGTFDEESSVVSSVLPGFSICLPDLFRSTR